MKNLNYSACGLFMVALAVVFTIGCASEPVKFDLPADHPAHPGAQEAQFAPPPNPFQPAAVDMQDESVPAPMMKHEMHQKSGQQQMDHMMGTPKGAESDAGPDQKSDQPDDNQHKGHGQ